MKVDVNLSDGNWILFIVVCEKGYVNVVIKLLENGVIVN